MKKNMNTGGKYMLPQDPIMLLSMLNMKLRDNYSSLDDLFDDMDIDKAAQEEIIKKLSAAGYNYDSAQNRFI